MLYEIDEERVYCGPAALMAISGKSFKQIRATINSVRGRSANRPVMGLANNQLCEAADKLNIYLIGGQTEYITLSEFAQRYGHKGTWILNVTGHYVALEGDTCIDNHVRFGCPPNEHRSRRKYVRKAFRLIAAPN